MNVSSVLSISLSNYMIDEQGDSITCLIDENSLSNVTSWIKYDS